MRKQRWNRMVLLCAMGMLFEIVSFAEEMVEVIGNVEVFLAADETSVEQITIVNDEGIAFMVVLDEKGLELKAMDGKRVTVKGVMTEANALKVLEYKEVNVSIGEDPSKEKETNP